MSLQDGSRGRFKRRDGDLTVVVGRKLYLVSPGGGMVWAVVFHFSVRNAMALPTGVQNTEDEHRLWLQTWCLKQTHWYLFSCLLLCMFCGFFFFFFRLLCILHLPLHMAVSLSLCHLTLLLLLVYFYECLQYLMEAKKAQQSLESTYKQLDSVSLKEASIILDVSCWICFLCSSRFVFVWGSLCKEGRNSLEANWLYSAVFQIAIFFYSKNRWTERKSVPHFRPL